VHPHLPRTLDSRLKAYDPSGRWRTWWADASGEPLILGDRVASSRKPPAHPLPAAVTSPGSSVGINVGGHYLRVVVVQDGQLSAVETVRLGTGSASSLLNSTVKDFLDLVALERRVSHPRCVGIAWSAPRTSLGLRAMSTQMLSVGEIGQLLHRGVVDATLSLHWDCPVFSWNDGEAVAAAECAARDKPIRRPLLVLKLGTSFASGLATTQGVCALPLQLAKCVLRAKPLRSYEHPAVGLRGTARDLIGAEPITTTYRAMAYRPTASYSDYCDAVLAGDPIALAIAHATVAALAELVRMVSLLWAPVTLVLSGKNLEAPGFQEHITHTLRRRLRRTAPRVIVDNPVCSTDTSAALGAVLLSLARL